MEKTSKKYIKFATGWLQWRVLLLFATFFYTEHEPSAVQLRRDLCTCLYLSVCICVWVCGTAVFACVGESIASFAIHRARRCGRCCCSEFRQGFLALLLDRAFYLISFCFYFIATFLFAALSRCRFCAFSLLWIGRGDKPKRNSPTVGNGAMADCVNCLLPVHVAVINANADRPNSKRESGNRKRGRER